MSSSYHSHYDDHYCGCCGYVDGCVPDYHDVDYHDVDYHDVDYHDVDYHDVDYDYVDDGAVNVPQG